MSKIDDIITMNRLKMQNIYAPLNFNTRVDKVVEHLGNESKYLGIKRESTREPKEKKPFNRIMGYSITATVIVITLISMIIIFPYKKLDSGISPVSSSAISPAMTETPQIIPIHTQIEIDDNNRTNLVNGGFIFDDKQFIFYKNYADECALYRIDKKTGEKLKLSDAYNSVGKGITRPKRMLIAGVIDDKVYFTTSDQERNTAEPDHDFMALYSINKDGTNRNKLISLNWSCTINNGYAYYVITDESTNIQNFCRFNITSGSTEILIENYTGGANVFNEAENKMYYIARDEYSYSAIFEFDLNLMTGKAIITNDKQTKDRITDANFLNYYENALYYSEGKSVKRCDLLNNKISIISMIPADKTSTIKSLAVSDLGIFIIAGTSLYNAGSETPKEIIALSGYTNQPGSALADRYIIITNTLQGTDKTSSNDYVKAYTLEGKEADLKF